MSCFGCILLKKCVFEYMLGFCSDGDKLVGKYKSVEIRD